MKAYFFYVLYTADGYFYGGFTDDVLRRLATHESGKGAKFTRVKSRHPLKLIYQQKFGTKSDALKAEAAFKKLTRSQKEMFLLAHKVTKVWQ
ncbi:GIY-YIG nuclease family protein [Leuconostoc pseudomesenteroides]|uniref:GIY-YIG nuclease family protein n=1 Tax=Leuconostoc pseudomesenteroides TaxID=33968 RepID=UPI0021A9F920|nr:GIY-YIG nuclease family protein [Leuconostoc pseudomesenteroides]MCT4387958.1 GIY-YIG nuclease family protein [Leuconostoc pseudomesenteroides]